MSFKIFLIFIVVFKILKNIIFNILYNYIVCEHNIETG